jgi:hypothetical protein
MFIKTLENMKIYMMINEGMKFMIMMIMMIMKMIMKMIMMIMIMFKLSLKENFREFCLFLPIKNLKI